MMCEKGAYGSLINSRVLSCEARRGKAATAEMAEVMSAQPPPPGGKAAPGAPRSWRGSNHSSWGKTERESTPNLTNMMFVQWMLSCSSSWGSLQCVCFALFSFFVQGFALCARMCTPRALQTPPGQGTPPVLPMFPSNQLFCYLTWKQDCCASYPPNQNPNARYLIYEGNTQRHHGWFAVRV